MMDAVNEPGIHTVVIKTSSQVGKTEIINNIIGYYIAYDPSPILVVQPTLEMGQAWSTDRLAPMLRDSPALADKIKSRGAKDTGDRILHKQFVGGHITIAGANSPASLASRPIRILLADEVDRYPASAGKEGDPVSLARKRTTTFWNRKIILTSTPTDQNSRIEREHAESDQREFYVPCPECGYMQTIKWKQIIIPKDEEGNKHPEDTYMVCEQGCVIDPDKKPSMIRNGEWRATKAFTGVAGFFINELSSPWVSWAETAQDFLIKCKDPETLKTWTNTAMGEIWIDHGESAGLEIDELLSRRENYDIESIPDDVVLLTCAVDMQNNRLEALVQGWGENKERWNLEHRIFWGDTASNEVWDELDDYLLQTFDGHRITATGVDTGGGEGRTDMAYNFCKGREGRRVFALKGSNQYYAPLASKPTQAGRQRVMLHTIGTDTAKDLILMNYLHMEGKIHFPHTVDEEFFAQLLGEERKQVRHMGQDRNKWVKTRDRQEILDLHVYNECVYAILRPNIPVIKAKKARRKDPIKEAPEEQLRRTTQRPIRRPPQRRNWVTDL